MDTQLIYEIIGYVASILVAIAITMRSIVHLRLVNMVGAIFFTIYGVLIQAYPVAIMNALIVFINLYYLWKMYNSKEYFELLPVNPDSIYLQHFLEFYRADINKILPNFQYDPTTNNLIWLILRDMNPAGVFIGKHEGESLFVTLDYVIPGYRDFKSGKFVYADNLAEFKQKGIKHIYSPKGYAIHEKYLKKIGFVPDTNGQYKMSI